MRATKNVVKKLKILYDLMIDYQRENKIKSLDFYKEITNVGYYYIKALEFEKEGLVPALNEKSIKYINKTYKKYKNE